MKPRLKVAKGYSYRIILVDEEGRAVWDDVRRIEHILPAMEHLTRRLVRQKEADIPGEKIR